MKKLLLIFILCVSCMKRVHVEPPKISEIKEINYKFDPKDFPILVHIDSNDRTYTIVLYSGKRIHGNIEVKKYNKDFTPNEPVTVHN